LFGPVVNWSGGGDVVRPNTSVVNIAHERGLRLVNIAQTGIFFLTSPRLQVNANKQRGFSWYALRVFPIAALFQKG
jgi:hypothetical protein